MKIDTTLSAKQLVENILLGSGVVVGNVRYSGAKYAIAHFQDSSAVLSIRQGLLLTSGSIFRTLGPNKSSNMSWVNKKPGFPKLDVLARGPTYDAAILEFDFVTSSADLSFNFVFASEEYPEYVGSRYNDVFGFFIHGPGLNQVNLAVLPRSEVPITVNSINSRKNRKYYVDNPTESFYGPYMYDIRKKKMVKNEQYKSPENLAKYDIQFDGFTTLLPATCKVIPGAIYHIQLVIADAGDVSLDSGVYLEAHSFKSTGSPSFPIKNPFLRPTDSIPTPTHQPVDSLPPPPVEPPSQTIAPPQPPAEEHPEPRPPAHIPTAFVIEFPFDSDALTDSSKSAIKNVYDSFLRNAGLKAIIISHTDSFGSDSYNDQLSQRRSQAVASFLAKLGMDMQHLTIRYRGEKEPIQSNETETGRARNRRSEIRIQQP